MYLLGLSCFFHDAAACLLRDGQVVAAAQEERFSRRKHDAGFPVQAARYCLEHAGIRADQLEAVVFYEKPFLKLDRILLGHFEVWPRALGPFVEMQRAWLGGKARLRSRIRKDLGYGGAVLFCRHHEAHAASAFYASPFDRATVVTLDGVGEKATTTICRGEGRALHPIEEIRFPHSLGLFYSAFTGYLGFEVNEDEYKVMGLAPYGQPRFADRLRQHVIRLHSDGSFELVRDFFAFERSDRMIDVRRAERLLGIAPRAPAEPLTDAHKDLAASVQRVLEEAVLAVCRRAIERTGEPNLCLAGGVALNCTANGLLARDPRVKGLYVFPAAGDAGGAVGAALFAHHQLLEHPRTGKAFPTPLLGPEYPQADIDAYLGRLGIRHRTLETGELLREVARLLADQKIVGWFQGRMEFGPRALGNRSILGDPTRRENWGRINRKVKFREDFRPLAPAVREEDAGEYFDVRGPSPFMLLAAPNRTQRLPAVTHVDGSSRLQTVSRADNELFHGLLGEFARLAGVPVLINTSFNTSGMPIVCSPQNAMQCFAESDLDVLVLGRSIVLRSDVPHLPCRQSDA